jgi:hypothetical protein
MTKITLPNGITIESFDKSEETQTPQQVSDAYAKNSSNTSSTTGSSIDITVGNSSKQGSPSTQQTPSLTPPEPDKPSGTTFYQMLQNAIENNK